MNKDCRPLPTCCWQAKCAFLVKWMASNIPILLSFGSAWGSCGTVSHSAIWNAKISFCLGSFFSADYWGALCERFLHLHMKLEIGVLKIADCAELPNTGCWNGQTQTGMAGRLYVYICIYIIYCHPLSIQEISVWVKQYSADCHWCGSSVFYDVLVGWQHLSDVRRADCYYLGC